MNPKYMDVTIPEKIIIGVTNRNKSVVTKYEEGRAGKAKMDTLRRKMKKGTKESIIDNIPYTGFVIDKINYNEWSVKDPRGFEVRLTETNILTLLKQCIIDKGEIVSKCAWAWRRSLFLVSLDDPDYQQIINNGNKDTSNLIKAKDLNIGDVVRDKYNQELTFRGKYYQLYFGYRSLYDDSVEPTSAKKFWFTTKDGNVICNSGGSELVRISESKEEDRDEQKNYSLIFNRIIKKKGRCFYVPVMKKKSFKKIITSQIDENWKDLDYRHYFRNNLNSIKLLEVSKDEVYIMDSRSLDGKEFIDFARRVARGSPIKNNVRLPIKSYTMAELDVIFSDLKTFNDKIIDSSQKYSNKKVLTDKISTKPKLQEIDINFCKIYRIDCGVYISETKTLITLE